MFTRIRHFLAPPIFEGDEDKTRVARLLNAVLLVFVGAVIAYGVVAVFLPNPAAALPLTGTIILMSLMAFFMMQRGRVQGASFLFLSAVWLFLTTVTILFGGVSGPAFFGYIVVVVVAGLLLGGRGGFLFAGLSAVAGLGLVWAEAADLLPPPLGPNPPISIWAALSLFVILAAALLQIATSSLYEALERARGYATELEEQRRRLEDVVEERTRDLVRRTRYLEATAEVARDAASVLEQREVLSRAANRISERFGFYHTGIFLLDPGHEWAVLQAASSEGGQRMLDRGHRLRVGEVGIVGFVAARGIHRIALDVGRDAIFFDNPDLPETRSEMALPLRARGEIIGVLDVQSAEPEAFGAEDVAVLQTLADQVAVAISNARLFRQAEESLEAERRAYGQLSREAWQTLLRVRPDLGVVRDRQGLSPAGDLWLPEMRTALRTGGVAHGEDGSATLALPVVIRNQVIGVVDVEKAGGSEEWSQEEIALLQMLVDQLGLAVEGARLYRDTERREVQERLAREITTRMRETLDVDTVLQTAVSEMRKALGIASVEVRIGSGPGRDRKVSSTQPNGSGQPEGGEVFS